MNLNLAQLIGRVTRDPEIKALPSGTKVANLGIATNSTYKNKDGEKVEEVEYHNVTAFGKLAEIIGQYVKKGQLIYISGKIKTRSWEADGVKKYKTDIVADQMQMGPKSGNTGSGSASTDAEDAATDKEADEEIDPNSIPF
jgi:single-strand DNA-binding protein